MDNLPPVSSAPVLKSKVKPSGALKRLSQKGGIYRGIRSYGRAQKVLKPVTRGTYDLDTSPVTTKRRTKAPSVDPESIDWSTRDTMSTAGAKKRRLKLASTSGSVTIEEKVRHAAGSKAQVLPRRSEGRSDRPTSREHKASRTPRVDDGGNLPVIDADRQAEAPSLKTRLMADPDTMEHDAMEGEQDLMSIGDQPDLPESTMANTGRSEPYKVSSDRQSGSRPRKEGSTGGRGPIHRLRNNASTSLSAKKRETASHRTSQDNDTQQTLELADQAHAGENVEPPTSVQAGQHSDERQRENSADAPEETAIAPQSVPSAMRVDKGPNDNSRDGPETGDDDNGSVDKITKDLESYNRLEEAYRALRSIGLKKDAGHDVRSKMPPIQTAAAREVLQACIEAKNRISKVGDQETPSTADADIRSHIMRTRTMASKIWEDTLWKQSWESVQDVFVFVIPTLTKLLRRLLRSFMFEREDDLSVDQLEISRLLMKTIVEGGRKAKGVTSKIKTDFPIKNIIKMGIVPNIAVALNGFQARLTFLQKIQMAEDEKRQAEIARQNAAVEEARRAEMRRQEAEIERRCEERQQVMQQWKRHWRDLHSERMRAELIGRALILSPDKLKQLEMVPLAEPGTTETVELDADGEPIELSQDFTTRQSQVPGQADTRLDWSIDESYALMKGLREAAGTCLTYSVQADLPLTCARTESLSKGLLEVLPTWSDLEQLQRVRHCRSSRVDT